ncbi:MAG: DEAD/DEAH box helicase, partial [Lentimicrobium sp.]|nr:DEAD/DEAH box helicase [Lentimicrobium sp.]
MHKLILERLGIGELKPMQEAAIEAVKPGNSLVLISPTGSGKTLAFLLPLLSMIQQNQDGVQALILTPSRELALQIEQVFKQMQSGLKVNTCYGGHPMKTERNNLKEPPALLIGTPGRIADHLRRNTFDTSGIRFLVLDEFDKSLELGFRNEMEFIIGLLRGLDTRILTSATALPEIPEFAGVVNPEVIDFSETTEPLKLSLNAIRATGTDKLEALFRLIGYLGNEPALVFCNHRETVERISDLLRGMGVVHGIYHGGLDQEERE